MSKRRAYDEVIYLDTYNKLYLSNVPFTKISGKGQFFLRCRYLLVNVDNLQKKMHRIHLFYTK